MYITLVYVFIYRYILGILLKGILCCQILRKKNKMYNCNFTNYYSDYVNVRSMF